METLLREMEAYAAEHHVPIINERGRGTFLAEVEKAQPHRVLEIGMAIGYSTLLLAQHSAKDVRITTLELSEVRAEIARRYMARSPYADQITIHVGDAGELLTQLAGTDSEPYDFVFIDAAKGQYVDYFHKIQPLIGDAAVILADNVLFRGYVRSAVKPPRRYKTIVKRLREYIDLVSAPPFTTEILEHGDGLAVTRRISIHDQKA